MCRDEQLSLSGPVTSSTAARAADTAGDGLMNEQGALATHIWCLRVTFENGRLSRTFLFGAATASGLTSHVRRLSPPPFCEEMPDTCCGADEQITVLTPASNQGGSMPHGEQCVITLDRHVTRGFSDEFTPRLCVHRNFGNSTRD